MPAHAAPGSTCGVTALYKYRAQLQMDTRAPLGEIDLEEFEEWFHKAMVRPFKDASVFRGRS